MAKKIPNLLKANPEKRSVISESRFAGERYFWSAPSAAGVRLSPETALSISAFFSAVHAISTDLAAVDLDVNKRLPNRDIEYVYSHPIYDLFNFSPDDESNPFIWRQTLIAHALLYGGGYAEIQRRGNGNPATLNLLDPQKTKFERIDGKPFYRLDNKETLPASDVLHISFLTLNGKHGLVISDLMKTTLGISYAADLFGASFFGNGARPSGMLKLPDSVSFKDEAARKLYRDGWTKFHAGSEKAGSIAILEHGEEWIPTNINPDEAQFLETRRYQILEVVRMLRVPPHLLGDYSESHYNNIEYSNLDYYQTTLKPWATNLEKEINLKLFKPSERKRFFVRFNFDEYRQVYSSERSNHFKTLFENGIINRNEWRFVEGYNSLGNEGNQYYITKQIQDEKTSATDQ